MTFWSYLDLHPIGGGLIALWTLCIMYKAVDALAERDE